MGPQRNSFVWTVFTKNDDGIHSCNLCHAKLSSKSSTSNLKKHIVRKHPSVEYPTSDVIIRPKRLKTNVTQSDIRSILVEEPAITVEVEEDADVSIEKTFVEQSFGTLTNCFSCIRREHEREEKKSNERRKHLLYLVHQFLEEEGYGHSAEVFETEAQLSDQLTICDNMDLKTILQEYESYYHLRFQKYPKICKRVSESCSTARQNQPQKLTLHGSYCKDTPKKSLPLHHNNTQLLRTKLPNHIAAATNSRQTQNENDCNPDPASKNTDWKDIISKEIFMKDTNVRWIDVKGLDTAKKILKEAVVYPAKYPQFFTSIVTPWNGLLLFGPSGTGKTLLAKAVAAESKTNFFNVSGSSIIRKWGSDLEKLLKVLFEEAKLQAPSTIFLDELDALVPKEDGFLKHEASQRLKTELLIQLDRLAQSKDRVFILATSSAPWNLDPEILKKIEKRILVDLPNQEARVSMISDYLPEIITDSTTPQLTSVIDYDVLAKKMDGYTGSDIKLVCKETTMHAMRKAFDALEELSSEESELESLEINVINNGDVEEVLEHARPSASHLLQKHKKWQEEFGSR